MLQIRVHARLDENAAIHEIRILAPGRGFFAEPFGATKIRIAPNQLRRDAD